ncbi:MAG: phosphonoacetaldehyde hydrolase [Planctomycetaceae bacterium]|nr:phosphonoacetaldehyde hydrolase [Planctomycetaceae bacterium]
MKKNNQSFQYRGLLRAVIFDLAGTVVDYGSCAPAAAFVEVFKTFDVEITTDNAREPMGRAKRDHIAEILKMPSVARAWRSTHGAVPDESHIEQIYERFLPIQSDCLKHNSRLIPGTAETVAACRTRSLKIGASTGYDRELMQIVEPLVRSQGFEPDCMLCADDVEVGRPAPWMCLENARRMGVHPMSAIVKVDDTPVGIEAGRNAGMWSVGISRSGNLVGLSAEDVQSIEPTDLKRRGEAAEETLFAAGAHCVIDTIAELPEVLDDFQSRLVAGEGP